MLPDTLDEAFLIFEKRTNLEKGIPLDNPAREYRLDRMRLLCDAFGNPQESVKNIHIAGSKGKGSTASYAAALLADAGYRVGIYSSPHLVDYRERFRLVDQPFPEDTALSTARRILSELPGLEERLPGAAGATTFELLTLFAFLLFKETGCDYTVLETGLGGRLDATNVISHPEVVILTPIEKEHTEILGSHLAEIAAEKAGIMKKGVPVWSAPQKGSVRRVFRRYAAQNNSDVRFIDRAVLSLKSTDAAGTDGTVLGKWDVEWADGHSETLELSMAGRIQAENACLAIRAVRGLLPGVSVQCTPLAKVTLPGRSQFLRRDPPILIDGAHTAASIAAVTETFAAVAGDNPILLFGSVLGKNHQAMAHRLCGGHRPLFNEVIISTPGTFKPSNPPEVAESFEKTGASVKLIPDPQEAWNTVLESAGESRAILVTGSFFMAGEIARLGL